MSRSRSVSLLGRLAALHPHSQKAEGRVGAQEPVGSGQASRLMGHMVGMSELSPGARKYPLFLLFLPSLSLCPYLCFSVGVRLYLPLSSLLPLPAPPLLLLPEGSSPSVGARLSEWTMAWSTEVLGLSPWSHNSQVQLAPH